MDQDRGLPTVPPGFEDMNENPFIPDARMMRREQDSPLPSAVSPEAPTDRGPIEAPPGFTKDPLPEVSDEERFAYALKESFSDPEPEESRMRLFSARVMSELTGVSFKSAYDGSYSIADALLGEKRTTMKGFFGRVRADVGYNWKLQSQVVPLYLRYLNGEESPELFAAIQKVEGSLGEPPSMEGKGIFEKIISGAAQQMPMYLKSTAEGAKVGLGVAALAALTAGIAGQVGPQIGTPEEAVTVPGAAGLGFKTGFKVGSSVYLAEMMAALTYRDLLNMRDKNGNPIDKRVARPIAWSVGIVQGLIENAQFQQFTKTIGFAKSVSDKAVGKAVFGMLTNSKLWNLAVDTAKFVGAETLEEVLQEVASIGGEELLKQFENAHGADFDRAKAGVAFQRLLSTALQSGFAMVGMGLPGVAMRFGPSVVQDVRTLSQSRKFADIMDKTVKAEALPPLPPGAPSAGAVPRMNKEEFKSKLDVAYPNVAPERKDAYLTVLEKLAFKQGSTLDEYIGTHVGEALFGKEEGESPQELYQVSLKQIELARSLDLFDDNDLQFAQALRDLSQVDIEIGQILGQAPKNTMNLTDMINENQQFLSRIRAVEEVMGVKLVDESDRVIGNEMENRTKIEDDIEKPLFPMFNRQFAQSLIDAVGEDRFESFRSKMVKAAEIGYKQKQEGVLPKTFDSLFLKGTGKDIEEMSKEEQALYVKETQLKKIQAPAGEFRVASPLKGAKKTVAALNLNSMCPMFFVGGRGCYLDGCYVTGMGKAGSVVRVFNRAMYTAEILQLDDKSIKILNKTGGIRVNGQGDLSMVQKAQLRDIFKHAAMVGLDLKIITKQEDTFKMVADFQKDADPYVSQAAKNVVVQASCDPYWVPATTDFGGGVKAMHFIESIESARQRGDTEAVAQMQNDLIDYYKSLGRDAKIINGEVYRKYGFSSDQIKDIAAKYPGVKVQVRIVVATPKEIAEFALKAPQILQTWMHAKLPDGVYSDVEKKVITQDAGNYQMRIDIKQAEGEWKVLAQNANGDIVSNRSDYSYLESYIKKEYSDNADYIFRVLSGQLSDEPGSLCCTSGASSFACMTCSSYCQSGSYLAGDSLSTLAQIAHDAELFQEDETGKRGSVSFMEDGRAIMRGFESGDFSTLVHETAHIFRRDLEGDALKDAEDFCGVVNGVWARDNEEKFATAFEDYLATQDAPTAGLKTIFAQFKEWLYEIYGGIRSKLTPKMKAVFDNMFSDELQRDDKDDVVPEEFPATRQEIASRIKNAKQRVRYLTGQVKVSELVKDTDAMKEAYRQAEKAGKAGVKEGRAEVRARLREQKYIKDMREYAMRLAKYIAKPVSKAIDFFYAEAIEAIGAGIDPKFRSDKKMAEIASRRDFLARHPDKVEDMPRKLLEEMEKQSIQEMTVSDLEKAVAERRHLEQVGRLKLRLTNTQRKRAFAGHLDTIINTINEGKDQAITEGNKKEGLPKRLIQSTQAWLLRPMRILDALDGGQAFTGPTHDYLYNRVNRFINAAMIMEDKRKVVVQDKINELGVMSTLFKKEAIGPWEFTHDQIIDIYMGMQNEKKRLAIIYGNFLKHSEQMTGEDALDMIAQFLGKLSPKEVEFGDFLIDEYDQNYARLRSAFIAFTNTDLGKEERYSPIKRVDPDYGDALPEQLAKDMLARTDFVRVSAEKGFTIARKEIPEEFQKEIALGAMSTWMEQVHKQEHFIHGANTIRDVQSMVNNDSFRLAVREKIGAEYVMTLKDYANRVAAPDVYKTFTSLDRLSKTARNHVAIAALSYNLATMMKQLPGAFLFLADAGPAHFIGAVSDFILHPSEVIRFANTEPQLKQRSLDRFTEELKQSGRGAFERFIKKIGSAGIAPLYWLDKATVAIGYKAVYKSQLWKYGDETLAKQEALNAVLRTQPAGHAKDIARLYASDEWLNWFLMFTNQLNQFYNMMAYDIPLSHKHAKGGNAYKFFTALGMTINAVVIWSITNKRFPEDKDDWADAMAEGFWSAIPVLGKIVLDIRDGWSGAMELPATKAIQGIYNLVDLLLKGKDVDDRAFGQFFEAISIVFGLPYVGGKRLVRFIDTGKPIELIGGKPKEKK